MTLPFNQINLKVHQSHITQKPFFVFEMAENQQRIHGTKVMSSKTLTTLT